MFRPPIVAICREMFCEGYVVKTTQPVCRYTVWCSELISKLVLKHNILCFCAGFGGGSWDGHSDIN